MAKVNVNEFVIQLEHISDDAQNSGNSANGETLISQSPAPKKQSSSLDVDTLVDLCVERVFQLLKEHKKR